MRTSYVSTYALNLLLIIFLLSGCGTKSPKTEAPEPAPDQSAAPEEQDKEAENKNKIQGINGFSGENELPRGKPRGIERPNRKTSRGKPRGIEPDEINGTPVPGSKFEVLQIGMTVKEVIGIAGKATWRGTYGKPFDFSGDRTAFILRYRNKGNLIFTGGKLLDSSKGNLIIINHDEKEHGMRYLLW